MVIVQRAIIIVLGIELLKINVENKFSVQQIENQTIIL